MKMDSNLERQCVWFQKVLSRSKVGLCLLLIGIVGVSFIIDMLLDSKEARLLFDRGDTPLSSVEKLTEGELQAVFGKSDRSKVKTAMDTVLGVESLSGTDVDGTLRYDSNGHLLVDKEVKQVFEYFLSARGEVSLEEVVDGFEQYSFQSLPEMAANEVVDLFYSYLIMKVNLAELMEVDSFSERSTQSYERIDDLNNFFAMRNQIRQIHLGQAVASNFYDDEKRYDSYQIEKARLSLDGSLGYQERMARLTQLEREKLSPDVAKGIQQEREYYNLVDEIEALRAEGVSNAKIFSVRENALGFQYAERMQELDRSRAEWGLRVQDYQSKRDTIRASVMSDIDKDTAIGELKDYMFTDRDKIKLKAYDGLSP
jgi:lipase chaperone LimK